MNLFYIPKVDLVQSENWTAIFLDGVLAIEDESFSAEEIMDILKAPYSTIVNEQQMDSLGECPDKLSDVVNDDEYEALLADARVSALKKLTQLEKDSLGLSGKGEKRLVKPA